MRSPLAEWAFLVQSGAVAKKNIPTFTYFVIPLLLSASTATALPRLNPFVAFGSDVRAATSSDVPPLPQLRVAGEAGLALQPFSQMDVSLSLGGMLVSPSIPADSILYRGYYGTFLATAMDIFLLEGAETTPFYSMGFSWTLARYSRTDLYFLAYSLYVAPGISTVRNRLDLRLALPLGVELRGDGRSLSAGLTLTIARARRYEAEGRR